MLLLLLIDWSFGPYSHTPRGNDQLSLLIPVLSHRLREHEFARPFPFLLPGFSWLCRRGQHVTRLDMSVVLKMLFRMESTASTTTTATTAAAAFLYPCGFFAGTKPHLPLFGPQGII